MSGDEASEGTDHASTRFPHQFRQPPRRRQRAAALAAGPPSAPIWPPGAPWPKLRSAAASSRSAPGTRRTGTRTRPSPTRPTSPTPSRIAGSSSSKAGPAVSPGSFPIEGDRGRVVEPAQRDDVSSSSCGQGVRWHNEAAGERARAHRGGRRLQRSTASARSRAMPTPTCSRRWTRWRRLDKYTVQDHPEGALSSGSSTCSPTPHAVPIIARECVDKFGDLKQPRGDRRHRPLDARLLSARMSASPSSATRATSWPACPHRPASRSSSTRTMPPAWPRSCPGKYDLGWEFMGIINRVDWVQHQGRPQAEAAAAPDRRASPRQW